jgi:lipopolysaccharide export system protein LptA
LGATVLRSQTLTVHYSDSDRVGTLATLELGPDGAQRIGRLEASGSVTIAHGAHSARSDAADFDLRANRITLTGHVVDISNAAVLRGYHLVTDLTTGISRIESAHQRRF